MFRNYNILLFIATISLFFIQCGANEEGCLDPSATNYDPSVDVNCCCEYPTLALRITHKADSLTFNYNTPYLDDNGNVFTISSWRLYISDFELVRADETSMTVTDSIAISLMDDNGNFYTQYTKDNFALIEKSTFKYTFGNINETGNFVKVRFKVGVSVPANHGLADNLVSSHPLGLQADSMYWNMIDGYIFNKIKVVTDTAANTTKTFEVGFDSNLVTVEIDTAINVSKGENITINLDLNYLNFLDGVKFQQDSDAAILQKIVANSATAFSPS